MRAIGVAALLAAGVMMLAGCSSDPTPAPPPSPAPTAAPASPTAASLEEGLPAGFDMVAWGEGVCTQLDKGTNPITVRASLERGGVENSEAARRFLRAAVQFYCPEYIDTLPGDYDW